MVESDDVQNRVQSRTKQCSSFVAEDDRDILLAVELVRCVRRWLIGPIWARTPLPQVEQKWIGAVLLALVALAFLLCLKGPALLCCVAGSFDDMMAPGGSIRGE